MKWLLIPEIYKSAMIEAIEARYEWWKVEDEKKNEERRQLGAILCYSNIHLMFKMPIARLKDAERVSRDENGFLCRPDKDCFLMIGEQRRRDLAMLLRASGGQIGEAHGKLLAGIVSDAMTIEIPEIHSFYDATGDEWQIIGWDREDAESRLLAAGDFIKPPLEWAGSQEAVVNTGAVRTGRRRDDYDAVYEGMHAEEQAANGEESTVGLDPVQPEPADDEIPF